jgi:uncharacterized heparinase superfamily protein
MQMKKFAKYIRTIRHLRAKQVRGQIWRRIRPSTTWKYRTAPSNLSVNGLPKSVTLCPKPAAQTNADGIRSGVFDFLNHEREMGRPPRWAEVESDLWGFHLHYFGYIHVLTRDEQEELCLDWIENNPIGTEPAWHPFPISVRLVNWCKAGLEHPDILSSMYRQAAYLHDHLETHLLGNHLLENARALVTAGVYLLGHGAAEAWVRRGLDLYEEQTPEQILADGGHIERSPMYHALMLEGYLDVIAVLETRDYPVDSLRDATERMRAWLGAMIDPDKRIALFNDSAHNGAPSIPHLLSYADRVLGTSRLTTGNENGDSRTSVLRVNHLKESGYVSVSGEDLFFIVDGGPVGPDYLPAHAHADIFTFILRTDGCPWIVDTGTSTYEEGATRQYERSTRAHNTVTVDDVDQVECWGAFRVARRFAPACTVRRPDEETVRIDGTFDGYASLIGDDIVHSRRITVRHRLREIEVVDRVTGEGTHRVCSRIHLHPDVEVREEDGEVRLVAEKSFGTSTIVMSIVDSSVRVEKGAYAPEFGCRRETNVLVLEREQVLPVMLQYTIYY